MDEIDTEKYATQREKMADKKTIEILNKCKDVKEITDQLYEHGHIFGTMMIILSGAHSTPMLNFEEGLQAYCQDLRQRFHNFLTLRAAGTKQ